MSAALISATELAELLSETSTDPSAVPVVLADVRWRLTGPPGRPEYEAGHLPGAQFVDLEADLTGAHRPGGAGGRHPVPDPGDFAAAMRRFGVGRDTRVVVYDADTSLAASRLWWLLLDAGHPRVRVLDGGYAAWTAAGLPTATGPAEPVAAGSFGAEPGGIAWGHAPQIDGAGLAAQLAGQTAGAVVDVRAAERYRGDVEPMDPVAGHIPGAVNLPSTDNLTADGRFRAPAELAERFAELGESPVLYCGSGITAAHTLLAMSAAGRADGVVYPGSWSDWITDPDRPLATGPDPR